MLTMSLKGNLSQKLAEEKATLPRAPGLATERKNCGPQTI